MCAGSIAEEAQLLFFDAVFHFAPGTVKLVVKFLGLSWETGYDITRIGSALAVFGFDDDTPFAVPSIGLVFKLTEEPNLGPAFSILAFGAALQLGRERIESIVLGDAHDVINRVFFAPAQHPPAAKPTIGPQRDLHSGPVFAQRLD